MEVYCPPSFRNQDFRVPIEREWGEQCRFCYDIVAAVRPSLLVAIGANIQEPYFACCQAMQEHNITGVCYSVDPVSADHVHNEAKQRNRDHYKSFSYLLNMDINAAQQQFNDESIEVLCLDAHPSGMRIAIDVESWLTKVAPGGILLVHGIAAAAKERSKVYEDWKRVSARHVLFELVHGHGLGILRKSGGPNLPQTDALLQTVFNPENHEQISRLYRLAHETDELFKKYIQSGTSALIKKQIGVRKIAV